MVQRIPQNKRSRGDQKVKSMKSIYEVSI